MEAPKITLTLAEQIALGGQLIRDGIIPRMQPWEAAVTASTMFDEAQNRIISDGLNPSLLLEAMTTVDSYGGGGELSPEDGEPTDI